MDLLDDELTEERREELIERFARIVDRRRLHTPAVFLLEMHKPISFFSGQTLLIGSGFLAPLFGLENVRQVALLIESRANIERLICRIEELACHEPCQ